MCLGLELLYYFLLFFKNCETILVFLLSLVDALMVPCKQWKDYKVAEKKYYHWSSFLVSVLLKIAAADLGTCSAAPQKIDRVQHNSQGGGTSLSCRRRGCMHAPTRKDQMRHVPPSNNIRGMCQCHQWNIRKNHHKFKFNLVLFLGNSIYEFDLG